MSDTRLKCDTMADATHKGPHMGSIVVKRLGVPAKEPYTRVTITPALGWRSLKSMVSETSFMTKMGVPDTGVFQFFESGDGRRIGDEVGMQQELARARRADMGGFEYVIYAHYITH